MKQRRDFWEQEEQRYIDCKKALDEHKSDKGKLINIIDFLKIKIDSVINFKKLKE